MTTIACTLRVLKALRKSPNNLLFYGKYSVRVFEEVKNEDRPIEGGEAGASSSLKGFTVYRGGPEAPPGPVGWPPADTYQTGPWPGQGRLVLLPVPGQGEKAQSQGSAAQI